jgi:hypothetical protein
MAATPATRHPRPLIQPPSSVAAPPAAKTPSARLARRSSARRQVNFSSPISNSNLLLYFFQVILLDA